MASAREIALSTASAQNQMNFQREMSNTAHQREVADLQAAGLNPVLSAKLGGASTPSGAAGDFSDPNTGKLIDAVSNLASAIVTGGPALEEQESLFGNEQELWQGLITAKNWQERFDALDQIGEGWYFGERGLTKAKRNKNGDYDYQGIPANILLQGALMVADNLGFNIPELLDNRFPINGNPDYKNNENSAKFKFGRDKHDVKTFIKESSNPWLKKSMFGYLPKNVTPFWAWKAKRKSNKAMALSGKQLGEMMAKAFG